MTKMENVRFRSTLAGLAVGVLLFVTAVTSAQVGASSSASARTRYLADAGYVPASREVAVEELINYHRHKLPLPKVGESVAMDTRWGNNEVSWSQPNAVLQIGFTTANANDRTDLRPLNLVLVIDKSGSMAEADKMVRVKQALLQFERQLRPTDLVGIVVFDSTAHIVMESQPLGGGAEFRATVNELQPGSSTNLNSGLMLGYQEAMRNFRKGATNRVIMLTDGIANTGVTDPNQIARGSLAFNDKGVDLTTIGLGLDLDKDLLRTLAKSGRGLFHFVADAQDIQKVFVDEVQSLVSPVARDVRLRIDYDPGLKVNRVFGYEPRFGSDSVSIELEDMNQGLTEIALLDFQLKSEHRQGQPYVVNVTLSYFDIAKNREVVLRDSLSITPVNRRQPAMLVDTEVRKNYTIALLAQAIKDMSVAWEGKQYVRAESIISAAVAGAHETYPNLDDPDIKYNLNIAENYQSGLRRYNQSRQGAASDR
jgi:Mg-chelatase subunit ChlD